MSHAAVRLTPQVFAPPPIITRMKSFVIPVGVVFLVLALVGAIFKWELFLRAWLFAFMFWLGLTLGSLVLLMLQYTSGGNWGRVGRRIWEAASSNLWLMFLFWLPIAFGMKKLYTWTDPNVAKTLGGDKAHLYLNQPFAIVRALIFFAVWGFLAW